MYRSSNVVKGMFRKYLNVIFHEIVTDYKFIREVLTTALFILLKNFAIIIIYSLLSALVLLVIGTFSEFTNINREVLIPILIFFAIMLIQAYTTLGLYKLIFTLIDSEYYEFGFSQIVPGIKMIFTYVVLSILSAVVIAGYNVFVLGLLLKDHEIIQEIFKIIELTAMLYLALRYMFCIAYIVDDSSGVIESLRQSFHLTKSNIFKIILILCAFFIIIAIPLIGIVNYGIKLLVLLVIVIYPYINIVLAVVYRKLIHDSKGIDDITTETI